MAFNTKLAHLLDERRIVTLTTLAEDGMPHVTAVWFLWEDGAMYIATGAATSKASNLARDPRIAVCIESREAGREQGMSASGHAELLSGEVGVRTPLQQRLARFGRYLALAVLAICAVVFVSGLLQGPVHNRLDIPFNMPP